MLRIRRPHLVLITLHVHADWFDVLDDENRPLLTERELMNNLQAIVADSDKLPTSEVCLPISLSLLGSL